MATPTYLAVNASIREGNSYRTIRTVEDIKSLINSLPSNVQFVPMIAGMKDSITTAQKYPTYNEAIAALQLRCKDLGKDFSLVETRRNCFIALFIPQADFKLPEYDF